MQLKFFTFSVLDNTNEEETLNKFLRSVKVLETLPVNILPIIIFHQPTIT